ncbi:MULTISPECIES: methylaspartate mutase [unclassified Streptomyces]|uniref:methylaspartate mutase n=1 Tax=unclassified Streptomyces TaxID=2593676 RepID=UPI001CBCB20E|nr:MULTISPECIES: methylaspartate mutase [unclassified Streptomyces]WPO70829.1 methylaspartate mutase [Streptomyces sp. KN37]
MRTSTLLAAGAPAAVRLRSTTPFGTAVAAAAAAGRLVVQPRMGFPDVAGMLTGLRAVTEADATTVGTVTLDSYTRVGDHASARKALDEGSDLNGFPIVAHGADVTRDMIARVGGGADFAIQVRHGSPLPLGIVRALLDAGLDATEGGPVSYCLPYSRTPLAEAVTAWADSCELLAEQVDGAHLESFGGCMLGQLCPPGLLVAISVLEGMFFKQHGLRSVSLSYAQGTSFAQDVDAIGAMRRLAGELLGDLQWHVVLYTYMGVFPRTPAGALSLLRDSAVLAAVTGTERMIVKTPAEAHRIPTVADNIQALQEAARAAESAARLPLDALGVAAADPAGDNPVYTEARALIDAVLNLDADIGTALLKAFAKGYLDVPYCLHTDNAQRSRSYIAGDGTLQWQSVGSMPLTTTAPAGARQLRADAFLDMLGFVQRRYDDAALEELPTAGPSALLSTALLKD